MAKEIIPYKFIANLNEDGTFKNGVLQYRIRVDGSMDPRKFFTIAIGGGIKIPDFNKVLSDSMTHAEKGEKMT